MMSTGSSSASSTRSSASTASATHSRPGRWTRVASDRTRPSTRSWPARRRSSTPSVSSVKTARTGGRRPAGAAADTNGGAVTVFCRTTMNYVAPGGDGLQPGPIDVDVHDGRADDAALTGWTATGFELVTDHRSAVTDWTDDVEIAGVHYAE